MTDDRNKAIVVSLTALGISIVSIVISYYLLDLGIWSWVIGGLVMTLCLLAYIYLRRSAGREVVARVRATDDEGFQKMERVLNRTVGKPPTGPLWESRVYKLSKGDVLKVEVIADHEVTARLVRTGPVKAEVDGSTGPVKRWAKKIDIREEGDHRVILDGGHPKITVTVKIGYKPK